MTKDGWKGVGYIVHDEITGAAAYRISGGKSGGLMFAAGGIASYRGGRYKPTKPPSPDIFKPRGSGPGLLTVFISILLFSLGAYQFFATWPT